MIPQVKEDGSTVAWEGSQSPKVPYGTRLRRILKWRVRARPGELEKVGKALGLVDVEVEVPPFVDGGPVTQEQQSAPPEGRRTR